MYHGAHGRCEPARAERINVEDRAWRVTRDAVVTRGKTALHLGAALVGQPRRDTPNLPG
jgi:hypothetical protein